MLPHAGAVVDSQGGHEIMQPIHARYRVDLPADHACCETNYARVLQLFPRLAEDNQQEWGVAVAGQVTRVQCLVSARDTYTTALQLCIDPIGRLPGYQFDVRLYHDANMAEVVAFQQQHCPAPQQHYPNRRLHQPDEKAQWNRFLGDWLRHCRVHGHSVVPLRWSVAGASPT